MKIFALHEAYVRGGAEHSLADLIAHWPNREDEWCVCTNAEHPDSGVFLAAGAKIVRLPQLSLDDVAGRRSSAMIGASKVLAALWPDCVLLNNGGFPGGSWNYVAMEVAAAHSVRVRAMIVRNASPTATYGQSQGLCSKYLTLLIAVTEDLRQKVDPKRVAPCRVERVYNGVPLPSELRSKVERMHGTRGFRCGVIARIEPRKGQHIALAAIAELRKQAVNVSLMLAGDADSAYVAELKATPAWSVASPQLVSHTRDREVLFTRLDALLVPSIAQESCSRVVLEAGARAIPCIVSNCGGLPELVDASTGWVVPIGDVSQLAQAISEASRSPDACATRGAAALDRVVQRHTAEGMARQYAQLLR